MKRKVKNMRDFCRCDNTASQAHKMCKVGQALSVCSVREIGKFEKRDREIRQRVKGDDAKSKSLRTQTQRAISCVSTSAQNLDITTTSKLAQLTKFVGHSEEKEKLRRDVKIHRHQGVNVGSFPLSE